MVEYPDERKGAQELDLAAYGEAVHRSLQAAHPGAVWVMQGWMFGYQRHIWSAARLQEFLSRIPDENMLLLDLAVDYTHLLWKQAPNSEFYHGFFGKPRVLSYIPDMGGKTGYSGVLDFYAPRHRLEQNGAPPAQLEAWQTHWVEEQHGTSPPPPCSAC